MLGKYNAAVERRFEDPQDTLVQLADLIVRADVLQGMEVYVDGFIGFTPVEERLLVALARKATNLSIALLGEPGRAGDVLRGYTLPRHPIFQPVEETLERLARLFEENALPKPRIDGVEPAAGTGRFASPALRLLEERFLSRAGGTAGAGAGIEFHVAEKARDEARLAAEAVWRFMHEEGFRPGEIAILGRDLESYADPLTDALNLLRIPFFIDRAEPLETHPLVTGIEALIRAALHPGDATHLIELGRSGLLPVPRRAVDRLENHVLQYPRTTKEWHADEDWKAPAPRAATDEEDKDLDDGKLPPAVDAARRKIVATVRRFAARFKGGSPTNGLLRDFIHALGQTVDEVIAGRGIDTPEEDVLQRIGALLGTAAEAAGDSQLPWDMAGDLAIAALRQLSLPRIPPMLDQVFVGQVDRSRYPVLKGVVLLGMAEGIFPGVGSNTTLLNDNERDLLGELGVDLRPGARKQFEREGLFAYRALSAASHRLVLLRPRVDGGGGPLNPSPYWQEIARLFTDLDAAREASGFDAPEHCWRVRELQASALRRLDETHLRATMPSPASSSVVPLADDAPGGRERRAVEDAARWRNPALLSAESTGRFLRKRLIASASRLEAFARCPFQHYTRSMLAPKELVKPEFERTDAGIYAHAVMRNLTRLLREGGVASKAIPAEQLRGLYDQARAKPREHLLLSGLLERPTGLLLFNKLDAQVWDLARWLKEALEALPFAPFAEEAGLQSGTESIARPLALDGIAEGWTCEVRGQIDRVDRHEARAKDFLVVDYKLREKRFDYTRWECGENIQLPLYMLAVEASGAGRRPLGGLYLEIIPRDDPEGGAPAPRAYRGVMRASAVREIFPDVKWTNIPFFEGSHGDPEVQPRRWGTPIADREFEGLMRRTMEMLKDASRRIIGGDVSIAPARHGTETACSQCSYRPVCMVDFRVNHARVRADRGRDAILSELGAGQ